MKAEKSKNAQKADFETSRLFYDRFWYFLPIISTKNYASQLE